MVVCICFRGTTCVQTHTCTNMHLRLVSVSFSLKSSSCTNKHAYTHLPMLYILSIFVCRAFTGQQFLCQRFTTHICTHIHITYTQRSHSGLLSSLVKLWLLLMWVSSMWNKSLIFHQMMLCCLCKYLNHMFMIKYLNHKRTSETLGRLSEAARCRILTEPKGDSAFEMCFSLAVFGSRCLGWEGISKRYTSDSERLRR